MPRALAIRLFGLSIAVVASGELAAQPPPPPPPGFPAYVKLLEEAFNAGNARAYADLFREDVKVYRDGKLVAANRTAFLRLIQLDFDRNLHIDHLSWAQGNQILVMEEVKGCIPASPDTNTVYHGCYWARTIRYDLAEDHKISAVHILEADRAWNVHAGK